MLYNNIKKWINKLKKAEEIQEEFKLNLNVITKGKVDHRPEEQKSAIKI